MSMLFAVTKMVGSKRGIIVMSGNAKSDRPGGATPAATGITLRLGWCVDAERVADVSGL